jgi:hypothetical protein
MAAGDAIARRVLSAGTSAEGRIESLFELALNARPSAEERDELSRFLEDAVERSRAEDAAGAELRAWSMASHALLASSRFQMVE